MQSYPALATLALPGLTGKWLTVLRSDTADACLEATVRGFHRSFSQLHQTSPQRGNQSPQIYLQSPPSPSPNTHSLPGPSLNQNLSRGCQWHSILKRNVFICREHHRQAWEAPEPTL